MANQFLVVFDTCAGGPAYYADVHNLLALPKGTTIGYDYRDRHFSADALQLVRSIDFTRQVDLCEVLLIYGQNRAYAKGAPTPEGLIDVGQGLWVATRLAHLRAARGEPREGGERLYLDLQVGEYPTLDRQAIEEVLTPLHAAGQMPFQCWVAVSDRSDALRRLRNADEEQGWSAIVGCLGDAPSQFAGDAFWRVREVTIEGETERTEPEVTLSTKENSTSVSARSFFVVQRHNKLCVVTGAQAPSSPIQQRVIRTQLIPENNLALLTDTEIAIRRHGLLEVRVDVPLSLQLHSIESSVRLVTMPESAGGYASGPNISLQLSVAPNRGRQWVGFLLAIVAAFLFSLIGFADALDTWTKVFIGALGIVAAIFAYERLLSKFPLSLTGGGD